jgi:hypothetical protein
MLLFRPHPGANPPDLWLPLIPLPADSGVFFMSLIVQTLIQNSRPVGLIFGKNVCIISDMKTTKMNRRGRPPKGSDQVKGIRLDMRLLPTEKQGFKAAAELAGLELSGWIRERLRTAARKELAGAGRDVPFMASRQA